MIKLVFDVSDIPTRLKKSIDCQEYDIAPYHTAVVGVERGEDFTVAQHFDLWMQWMQAMGYQMNNHYLAKQPFIGLDNPNRGCSCDCNCGEECDCDD